MVGRCWEQPGAAFLISWELTPPPAPCTRMWFSDWVTNTRNLKKGLASGTRTFTLPGTKQEQILVSRFQAPVRKDTLGFTDERPWDLFCFQQGLVFEAPPYPPGGGRGAHPTSPAQRGACWPQTVCLVLMKCLILPCTCVSASHVLGVTQ
ncbi:uncharacterized protein LOC144296976 [Canis aureus]